MPDDRKSKLTETNFLPPLNMVLTFLDGKLRKRDVQKPSDEEQSDVDEKNVEKLIEKLSEKEE